MLTDEPPYCKLVSNTQFIKTRGTNSKYEEAIEASAKYNKTLFRERKTRLPFLDSQTTVAQGNCMIWNREYQRVKPSIGGNGAVLHYQVKKWLKKRRLSENGDFGMINRAPNYAPTDLIQHSTEIELLGSYITNNQHIAYTMKQPPPMKQIHQNMYQKQNINRDSNSPAINMNHNHDNHHKINGNHNDWNMEDDENSKHDNENDTDDEEGDAKRKKKTGPGRGRGHRKGQAYDDADKTFICDQCGAKYKTRPGLSYHVQKTHNLRLALNPSGNGSHVTIPMNKITREPVDSINADDNTNSIFESVYDDNSSSMPQGSQASASTPLNQNTNSNQAAISKTNGTGSVKCGVCFGIEKEPRGQTSTTDKFITCSECTKQFHQTACLGFTATMIESVKKYKWLCIECKRCTLCGNSENDDKLLFCDDCDRGYHMYCLTPPITEAPAGDWRCKLCFKNNGDQVTAK